MTHRPGDGNVAAPRICGLQYVTSWLAGQCIKNWRTQTGVFNRPIGADRQSGTCHHMWVMAAVASDINVNIAELTGHFNVDASTQYNLINVSRSPWLFASVHSSTALNYCRCLESTCTDVDTLRIHISSSHFCDTAEVHLHCWNKQ